MVNLLSRFMEFRKKREERRVTLGTQREIELKRLSKLEIDRNTRIAEVREAQLRRAKAEAGIQRAKARQFKAARQVTQARQVPRSAVFFAPTRPMAKKKQPARDILGNFRVL